MEAKITLSPGVAHSPGRGWMTGTRAIAAAFLLTGGLVGAPSVEAAPCPTRTISVGRALGMVPTECDLAVATGWGLGGQGATFTGLRAGDIPPMVVPADPGPVPPPVEATPPGADLPDEEVLIGSADPEDLLTPDFSAVPPVWVQNLLAGVYGVPDPALQRQIFALHIEDSPYYDPGTPDGTPVANGQLYYMRSTGDLLSGAQLDHLTRDAQRVTLRTGMLARLGPYASQVGTPIPASSRFDVLTVSSDAVWYMIDVPDGPRFLAGPWLDIE